MNLQQTVKTLNNLHARPHIGGLEGHVGDAINLDTGRYLDPQRGIAGKRQEAASDRAKKGRVLRLEVIEKDVTAQFSIGHDYRLLRAWGSAADSRGGACRRRARRRESSAACSKR